MPDFRYIALAFLKQSIAISTEGHLESRMIPMYLQTLLLVGLLNALWFRHTGWHYIPETNQYVYEDHPEPEEIAFRDSDAGCNHKFALYKQAELNQDKVPSRYPEDPVIESMVAKTMSDEDYRAAKKPQYRALGLSDTVREGCR